ncbi:MAG: hypothetical protein ACSHWY_05860 [Octadecabacter sp.]
MSDSNTQRDFAPVIRMVGRILAIVLLVWMSHLALDWVMDKVQDLENASQVRMGVLGLVLLVYIILMAIPFVPGVEIGISLMMLEGGAVAPFVYIATFTGLLLAYFVGRRTDCIALKRVTTDLNLTKMSKLIEKIAPLDGEQRLRLLNDRLPKWVPPSVIRYRYVVLALLINLPGNSIIGGGGGLALIAGFSGLYSKKATVLTFAIAVSPVPFMVYFLDLHPFG